ncbi:GntR family transcriptional regulator [Nocardia sp. CA-119907]|uniref:GntR family transcriptional regulator n=1 Tax=Nocardia sp. CA-119907 TaxID=3239973 RepID=UPI003D965581
MADDVLNLTPLPPSTGRRMEQVVTAVRSAIDDGHMQPGVKYSVYQLADILGVSRTPVREALLRLEEVGLIKFEARQGFRIVLPQPREIAEIFAVRLALELPAVRKAATLVDAALARVLTDQRQLMHTAVVAADEASFSRHDLELHDLILAAAGNNRSRTIVASLRETTRLLGASTAHATRSLRDIEHEHDPILAAIIDGDPDRAEEAMRIHLVNTGKLLVRQAIRDGKQLYADDIWANAVS